MTPIDDIAKRSGNGDKEYPIDIRPATVADAGTILALEEHFPGDRLPPRSVRRLLRSPSARILIVERTGIPLGNLVLLMPRGRTLARIYSVIVAPLARGARLGEAMVTAAENEARARGYDRMGLEVRRDNLSARRLYERLGYTVTADLPDYYEDGAPGLRLRKLLGVDNR